MSEELPANLRRLKAVVAILGIIFCALLILFGYAIVSKMNGKKGAVAASVALAPGETVLDMASTADRVVLRLRDATGAERLLYIDPQTGASLGATSLVTAP